MPKKDRRQTCYICKEIFADVQDHGKKMHPGAKWYKCGNVNCEYKKKKGQFKCTDEKRLYSTELIEKHEKSDSRIPKYQPKYMPENKQFKCLVCDHLYMSKDALSAHSRRKHSNSGKNIFKK